MQPRKHPLRSDVVAQADQGARCKGILARLRGVEKDTYCLHRLRMAAKAKDTALPVGAERCTKAVRKASSIRAEWQQLDHVVYGGPQRAGALSQVGLRTLFSRASITGGCARR